MGYESSRGFGPANKARENARIAELQEQQRLRTFAARVTDEAHFQRILDDTQPGYRDAVEAALRPWLRFPAPTPEPSDLFADRPYVHVAVEYDEIGEVTPEQFDALAAKEPK